MSMIFQSYALWPHMTVAENIVYGLKLRKIDSATIKQEARRHPRHHAARAAGRALSRRTVRRPAAARGARPRADRRAGDAAARRAAVQPRRQPARGDALRGPPPARRIPLHHGLRHPRPVRGDDHRRRDLRDERRQDRAGRLAGGHLRPAALGVRRPLHRHEQRVQGQGARRRPRLVRRRAAARHRRPAASRRRRPRSRSASTRSSFWPRNPPPRTTWFPPR